MKKLIRRGSLKPMVKKTKTEPVEEKTDDAPFRWHKFSAYKRIEQLSENLERIDLDELYSAVIELRKARPVATEVQPGDNTVTVTNRGFKDQAIRSRVSAIKMRVFRASKELEAAIILFKKTVQYEDTGWLNHTYGKTQAKSAPEFGCLDAQYLVDRCKVFMDYADILIEDIDKASWRYSSGQEAVARDTVPEKFTRTS